MATEYKDIDNFFKKHLKYVIVDLNTKIDLKFRKSFAQNAFFLSEFDYYDFQIALLNSTIESILIILAILFVLVLVATRSALMTISLLFTVIMTNSTTFSVLILFGWELNFMESICIILSIGLSFNSVIHFALTYQNFILNSLSQNMDKTINIFFKREKNTDLVIKYAGSTIFISSLIYIIVGLILLSNSYLSSFQTYGLFLLIITFFNIFYSFFLFLPIISMFGHINSLCKINNCCNRSFFTRNDIDNPNNNNKNNSDHEKSPSSSKVESSRLSCLTTSSNLHINNKAPNEIDQQATMVLTTF